MWGEEGPTEYLHGITWHGGGGSGNIRRSVTCFMDEATKDD